MDSPPLLQPFSRARSLMDTHSQTDVHHSLTARSAHLQKFLAANIVNFQ